MAIMRTRSRIANPAPPPSPIPTAKGSRSASNDILTQFLDKTVHNIPDLTLPASRFPAPADVDLRSLASSGSINRLLRSAKEFGAFLVRGHGVSVDELRSLVREADWVFGNSSEIQRGLVRRNGDREEMVWIRNGNQSMESFGIEKYRDFSGKMDNIANKLDAIAEQLSQVFFTNAEKQQSQKIILQGKEIALSLYRYNHQNSTEPNRALHDELKGELFDHALSLHLPIEPCEFRVQSEAGPLSFDAGTEAIIVTVGKQIEEWSNKEFNSVSGEMIFSPLHINGSQPSFSIELRFSTSSCKNVLERKFKTISIIDQIVIAIVFALLYKFFVFISSPITGT